MPGGRLVFDVVAIPDSLEGRHDLADDLGLVATGTPYADLLVHAGFTAIGSADTTQGYLEVAARWLMAARDLESELRRAIGDEVFDDKLSSRETSFELLEAGQIGRTLYWATA